MTTYLDTYNYELQHHPIFSNMNSKDYFQVQVCVAMQHHSELSVEDQFKTTDVSYATYRKESMEVLTMYTQHLTSQNNENLT